MLLRETAFKKETVGLVTREQYVEKRVNIRTKIEEEEKEKLQKLQQEEEELQLQKLKKRKIKPNPKLSFSEEVENGEEEEVEDNNRAMKLRKPIKFNNFYLFAEISSNLSDTVVDMKICHPTEFDFYLRSDAGIQWAGSQSAYTLSFVI